MIVTVIKIGTGTDTDPYRPDTTASMWVVIEERENEFDVEILDESG